jgi:hypothetical protein
LDDVRVVRATDLGWTCEVHGRSVFVGRLQTVAGTSVPGVGQRGPITLTAAAARDLGLLDLATAVTGAGKRPSDRPPHSSRRRR